MAVNVRSTKFATFLLLQRRFVGNPGKDFNIDISIILRKNAQGKNLFSTVDQRTPTIIDTKSLFEVMHYFFKFQWNSYFSKMSRQYYSK